MHNYSGLLYIFATVAGRSHIDTHEMLHVLLLKLFKIEMEILLPRGIYYEEPHIASLNHARLCNERCHLIAAILGWFSVHSR